MMPNKYLDEAPMTRTAPGDRIETAVMHRAGLGRLLGCWHRQRHHLAPPTSGKGTASTTRWLAQAATLLALWPLQACKVLDQDQSALSSGPLRADRCGNPLDPHRANPNHCEGTFYLDGRYALRPEILRDIYRFWVKGENDVKKYEGKGVAANHFGSFLLKVPGVSPLFSADGMSVFKPVISDATANTKYYREHHYHLGGDRVGMRLLPIVDREGLPYDEEGRIWESKDGKRNPYFIYDKTLSNLAYDMGQGVRIYGSEEVDRYLRTAYGASETNENFPIFAMTSYIHPEQHEGTIFDLLAQKYLKTEGGVTHLGAYIGRGVTRNAPLNYRGRKWGISGYPATLATIAMDGVSAEVLNRNIIITLEILNRFGDGVVFPDDYKFDRFRAINLKEVFDFYRAWIDREWVRPEDEDSIYWTRDDLERYNDDELAGVAELVRVPGNGLSKTAMIDQIYDKQRRIPLYQKLTQLDSYRTYCAEHLSMILNVAVNLPQNEAAYREIWGADGQKLWALAKARYQGELGQELKGNQSFTPLWRKEGLASPLTSEVHAKGMVWPIMSTADIMAVFLENYLNWTDRNMSPYYSVAAIVGMMPLVLERMKIKPDEYLDAAVIPIYLILKHAFTLQRNRSFEKVPELGGLKKQALITHLKTVTRSMLWSEMLALESRLKIEVKQGIVEPVMSLLSSDASVNFILENASSSPTTAWENYTKESRGILQKLREHPGGTALSDSSTDSKYVLHYAPPSLVHYIASNMYQVNPHIKIKEVATAMEARELCAVGREYTAFNMQATLPSNYSCEMPPPP